jgi:hypothetical protein
MNSLKSDEVFIQDLVNFFPELKDEIQDEDYTGIVTLQIGCLMRFTQDAINSNNLDCVIRCYSFVESNINEVEYKIENALYISYLGKLDFQINRNAEKLLPEKLKIALEELKAYDTSKSKNESLNKFLDD